MNAEQLFWAMYGLIALLAIVSVLLSGRSMHQGRIERSRMLHLDAGAQPIRRPSPLDTDWAEIVDEKGEPPVVAEWLP